MVCKNHAQIQTDPRLSFRPCSFGFFCMGCPHWDKQAHLHTGAAWKLPQTVGNKQILTIFLNWRAGLLTAVSLIHLMSQMGLSEPTPDGLQWDIYSGHAQTHTPHTHRATYTHVPAMNFLFADKTFRSTEQLPFKRPKDHDFSFIHSAGNLSKQITHPRRFKYAEVKKADSLPSLQVQNGSPSSKFSKKTLPVSPLAVETHTRDESEAWTSDLQVHFVHCTRAFVICFTYKSGCRLLHSVNTWEAAHTRSCSFMIHGTLQWERPDRSLSFRLFSDLNL